MSTIDVKVPDIGDFKDVPVIEVLVKPGDAVKAEDSLVTLESDKATMDVPSPASGAPRGKSAAPRWSRQGPSDASCRGTGAGRGKLFGSDRYRMRDAGARR